MTIQPVTYRPITPIKPVSRKPKDDGPGKADRRPKGRRAPDPGTGEHLDVLV